MKFSAEKLLFKLWAFLALFFKKKNTADYICIYLCMRLCIVRRFIDYKFIKIDTSNGL